MSWNPSDISGFMYLEAYEPNAMGGKIVRFSGFICEELGAENVPTAWPVEAAQD